MKTSLFFFSWSQIQRMHVKYELISAVSQGVSACVRLRLWLIQGLGFARCPSKSGPTVLYFPEHKSPETREKKEKLYSRTCVFPLEKCVFLCEGELAASHGVSKPKVAGPLVDFLNTLEFFSFFLGCCVCMRAGARDVHFAVCRRIKLLMGFFHERVFTIRARHCLVLSHCCVTSHAKGQEKAQT